MRDPPYPSTLSCARAEAALGWAHPRVLVIYGDRHSPYLSPFDTPLGTNMLAIDCKLDSIVATSTPRDCEVLPAHMA